MDDAVTAQYNRWLACKKDLVQSTPSSPYLPPKSIPTQSSRLLITFGCALGDNVLLTAAVRDLALYYPQKFEIHVRTHFPAIWRKNPYVASWEGIVPTPHRAIRIRYAPYIRRADTEKLHFLTAFHRIFSAELGLTLWPLWPKADLYPDEDPPRVDGDYWVFVAGGKPDFTTKIWSPAYAHELALRLHNAGIQVVQAGAAGHIHPVLPKVVNLVGKTNYLQFISLIHRATGVICPITAAMHIAAAFDKPCVVLGGGREHWWWEAYVNVPERIFGPIAAPVVRPHKYLHVQDQLPCCQRRGCWKNKVTPAEDDPRKSYCVDPRPDPDGRLTPHCQLMITPEMVLSAVLEYQHTLSEPCETSNCSSSK